MSPELWSAILNPSGPNFERLKGIFACDRIPLQSPRSRKADLGEEKGVSVYMLNLNALPLAARARVIDLVARKSGAPMRLVEEVMQREGFPIREADVIVSFDMRSVV